MTHATKKTKWCNLFLIHLKFPNYCTSLYPRVSKIFIRNNSHKIIRVKPALMKSVKVETKIGLLNS